ncbi:histidine phosphotransferase family protein [Parvularcula lutaonensis]|uniref:Histidine phosphotransferase family protein n=1 Tax=Parvularcula lutaonensis TaxID=491923 RepID=A0ABV7MBD2_9PROT|nr:histidine phosphotransferase family protein [Parvularcula lutaonensis]GGY40203.1 histidine phosphotransferase ChpT [Parvularcula lutaonensis]
MQHDSELDFASLLASRLCHDLVNPAGALNTGLDVVKTETDPMMIEEGQKLIATSMERVLSMIEFARVAYGASGGSEGTIDMAMVRDLTKRVFAHFKADLDWQIEKPGLEKAEGRALMNLLLVCERIVPRRDSVVRVEEAGDGYAIIATGKRAKVPEDVAAAFAGADGDFEPKAMPARLAQKLAATVGKSITVESGEDMVTILLR